MRDGVAFLTWVAVDGAVDALGAAVAVHVHLEHRGHHGRLLLPVLVLPLRPLLLLVLLLVTVLPLVVLLVLVALRRGRVAGVGRGGRLLVALLIRRLLLLPAPAAAATTTTPSTAAAALLLRSINTVSPLHHTQGGSHGVRNKNRD